MIKTIAEQLGITEFPFEIKDRDGRVIYREQEDRTWIKWVYDSKGEVLRSEDSVGYYYDSRYDFMGVRSEV